MYKKINQDIKYSTFFELVKDIKSFRSLIGKEYEVISIDGGVMSFVRKATGRIWKMDLKGVHRAYFELNDFKTKNFRPYVPRTHSPALGLLLHVGLLKKIKHK